MFGGANSSGAVFGDTWLFSPSGQWSNVTNLLGCGTPGNCPTPRHDAAATYDRDSEEVVMFGGCSVSSPGWTESSPPCDANHVLNDTWLWNQSSPTGIWQKGPLRGPPARAAAGMGLLSGVLSDTEVLFGGCGQTCPFGDTWEFRTSSGWTQCNATSCAPPHSPAPRWGASMGRVSSYPNSSLGSVLLFGGCGSSTGTCVSSGLLNDTWSFSSTGWTQVLSPAKCLTGNWCPSPRYLADATESATPLTSSMLIYGGVGSGGAVEGDATEPGGGWWFFPTRAANGSVLAWWSHLQSPPSAIGTNSYVWTFPYPVAPPLPRYDGGMVDIRVQTIAPDNSMMFGGSSSTGSSLGDTWFLTTSFGNIDGRLSPLAAPSPRLGATMAWDNDSALRYVLLYGGCGQTCPDNQTWKYSNGVWTPLQTSGSPPALFNASMVWMNTDSKMVLFGGAEANGTVSNQTWTFDGRTWTFIAFSGATPGGRQSASLVYDPVLQYALLFGGCAYPCGTPFSDNWKLSVSGGSLVWTKLTLSSSPSARYGAAASWDSTDQRIVLFGGCGTTCPQHDTWLFGGTWTQCSCSSSVPARLGADLADDFNDGYAVLVGGQGVSGYLSDTWKYSRGAWAQVATGPTHPPPAAAASMVYDQGDSAADLFGGISNIEQVSSAVLWQYSGGSWTKTSQLYGLPANHTAAPRFGAAIAYDGATDQVVLAGGCASSPGAGCGPLTGLFETWFFTSGSWTRINGGTAPTPRWDSSFAYYPPGNYFVLFGGCAATSNQCLTTLSDTWKLFGTAWTQLGPSTVPSARGDAGMVYDSHDTVVVMFGGRGCGSDCQDTWSYTGSPSPAWSLVSSSTHPSARAGLAMAYDGHDGYVILFGGLSPTGTVLSDTWEFTLPSWSQLHITGPPGRFDASIAFDSVHQDVILFGGASSPTTALNDTWNYSGGAWNYLLAPIGFAPSPRWGAALVFDPTSGPNGLVVLFGGSTAPVPLSPPGVPGGFGPSSGETWLFYQTPNPSLGVAGLPFWYSAGYVT